MSVSSGSNPQRQRTEPQILIGRYGIFDALAAGGMATVHIGRLMGSAGFARTVAIKRLHARFAKDHEFVTMFLDEARLAARLRHPNVVPIHDVVEADDELFLVMDYVEGESLSRLLKAAAKRELPVPLDIVVAIVAGTLHGLHAAHEAKGDDGEPLNLVHRDVSPQNILVGVNGVPRILDFGIAKAAGRAQTTAEGQIKGKLAYMALEQMSGEEVDRRVDIFSAGVVLWEALAGRVRLTAPTAVAVLAMAVNSAAVPPSKHRSGIPAALDALVMRALERDPAKRFATAREFAFALEELVRPASAAHIGAWVREMASDALAKRAAAVAMVERDAAEAARTSNQGLGGEEPTLVLSPDFPDVAEPEAGVPEAGTLTPQRIVVPPPTSKRPVLLIAGALVLVSAVVVATVITVTGSSRPASEPPARVPLDPEDAVTTDAPSPSNPVSATTPEPLPTAPGTPTPTQQPAPSTRPPTTGTVPPVTSGVPEADCDPPYTVDARGVQRVKSECL